MSFETQMTLALLQELLMAYTLTTLMATKLGLRLALSSLEGMERVRSSPIGWCPYRLKKKGTGLCLGS